MERHVKMVHEKIKNYKCENCGKSFFEINKLEKHYTMAWRSNATNVHWWFQTKQMWKDTRRWFMKRSRTTNVKFVIIFSMPKVVWRGTKVKYMVARRSGATNVHWCFPTKEIWKDMWRWFMKWSRIINVKVVQNLSLPKRIKKHTIVKYMMARRWNAMNAQWCLQTNGIWYDMLHQKWALKDHIKKVHKEWISFMKIDWK